MYTKKPYPKIWHFNWDFGPFESSDKIFLFNMFYLASTRKLYK